MAGHADPSLGPGVSSGVAELGEADAELLSVHASSPGGRRDPSSSCCRVQACWGGKLRGKKKQGHGLM